MPSFPHRQTTPRRIFGFTSRDGSQRELKADREGIVRPHTAEDVEILDGFGLAVLEDEPKEADVPRGTDDTDKKPAPSGAEG